MYPKIFCLPPFMSCPEEQDNDSRIPGRMQQHPTFSTVLQGMRFIHQAQPLPPLDKETERIRSLPSILDLPNRRALAQQGFYGSEYAISKPEKDQKKQSKSIGKSNSSSAAERRKQFQDSVISRSKNWSLTENHEVVNSDVSEQSQSVDSCKHGSNLGSFSDRISSDSSTESADSNFDEHRYGAHQSSISHLRRQYQEAIRLSKDVEIPTFNDLNLRKSEVNDLSISNIRKEQVNKLMLSVDDDADYIAQSLLWSAAVKEKDIRLKGQRSPQSTITDVSPNTLNDSTFCHDKVLKDEESKANFPKKSGLEKSPEILSKNLHQPVSIVVEGEGNLLDTCFSDQSNFKSSLSRESCHVGGSSYGLNCLTLCARSDSSNTDVPQDNYYESEVTDGDSTPQPGDISPGMMCKSPNFIDSNKIQRDALFETPVSRNQSEVDDIISSSQSSANQEMFSKGFSKLKSIQSLPQESFELEEVSSRDNVQQDGKDNSDKLGPMEKSNSTYSDSSGFADVDTVGEITQQMSDFSQNSTQTKNSNSSTKLDKKESALTNHYDNKISHLNSLSVQDWYSKDSEIRKDASTDKTKADDVDVHVFVCKNDVEDLDKENVIPTLTGISYIPNETLEKSLVYSLNVPLHSKDKNSLIDRNKSVRYISSVNIETDSVSDMDIAKNSNSCGSIKQVSGIKHIKVKSEDVAKTGDKELSDNELDVNAWSGPSSFNVQNVTSQTEIFGGGALSHVKLPTRLHKKLLQRAVQSSATVTEGNSTKVEILRKAKETLIAARNHTVDWLLKSERQNSETYSRKGQSLYPFKTGRPFWASTLDLKNNGIPAKPNHGQLKLKDNHHSFDYLNDKNDRDFDCLSHTSFRADQDSASKFNNFGRESHTLDNMKWPEMNQETTDCLSYDSMDESIDRNQPSISGSSFGIPEDHLNYVRLAHLVNGPSIALGTNHRLPNKKYTPNVHIKDWIMLPRQRHLEEETLLLQHVVQHYKMELCVMETLLCNMYEMARTELTPEQRRDFEELQQLWSEVHKEVIKMGDLLASRLRTVMMGNEYYSPFNAMQIVQTMINLLREQLYHVQICIGRDTSCCEDYEIEANQSVKSQSSSTAEGSSVGSAWMSAISSQMAEIRNNLKQSEECHKQELQKQISELKVTMLSDVKGELSCTTNTKLLQLQLEERDNEIRQLKTELLGQNVNIGGTHQRHRIESDV